MYNYYRKSQLCKEKSSKTMKFKSKQRCIQNKRHVADKIIENSTLINDIGEPSTSAHSDYADTNFNLSVPAGYRIINLQVLGKQLFCKGCKEVLSLVNITRETVRGFASILHVKCHHCLLVNKITTSTTEENSSKQEIAKKKYDINYKMILAMISSGRGYKMMKKFCICLDMPIMTYGTYTYHNRIIDSTINNVKKDKSRQFTKIDNELTDLEQKIDALNLNKVHNSVVPKVPDLRKDTKYLRIKSKNSSKVDKMPENPSNLSADSLLCSPAHVAHIKTEKDDEIDKDHNFVDEYKIIFFDLETSGLTDNCEILQVAMRNNKDIFNKYVTPLKPIDPAASEVNGLINDSGQLKFYGQIVESFPLNIVLDKLLIFLKSFEKKCILVAHNCNFDAKFLIRSIQSVSMLDEYKTIIEGFSCSYRCYQNKYKHRTFKKGECTLATLASRWRHSDKKMHEAVYDTYLLEKFATSEFSTEYLITNAKSINYYINQYNQNRILAKNVSPISK